MFDEHAERALELGALGYVLKENAERDVLSCLESVAAGRRFVSPALAPRLARARSTATIERPLAVLTASERRVLRLVAQHRTSREIAELLGISHRTVQNHRAHVCAKLGLVGPHALVRFAVDHERELGLGPDE
jgi:DNA-binding NarL/FixJ family response regulator